MSKFRIKHNRLDHEGGTKFYQTFEIQYQEPGGIARTVSVVHYGPYAGKNPDRGIRPVEGGQIKIKPGADYARGQLEAKRGRGYALKPQLSSVLDYDHIAGMAELNRLFGTSQREAILEAMGLSFSGAEVKPTPEPEDTPIETARPEAWGSW